MSPETELICLSELARRTGKDVDTVRKWRDRDGLRVYAVGGLQVVLWGEFMAWLDSRCTHNRSKSVEHTI
jgi:hypothetical protein